jgi:hypothetical protein
MPNPTPIDITNMPELVKIAEEVEATKAPVNSNGRIRQWQ